MRSHKRDLNKKMPEWQSEKNSQLGKAREQICVGVGIAGQQNAIIKDFKDCDLFFFFCCCCLSYLFSSMITHLLLKPLTFKTIFLPLIKKKKKLN